MEAHNIWRKLLWQIEYNHELLETALSLIEQYDHYLGDEIDKRNVEVAKPADEPNADDISFPADLDVTWPVLAAGVDYLAEEGVFDPGRKDQQARKLLVRRGKQIGKNMLSSKRQQGRELSESEKTLFDRIAKEIRKKPSDC